MAGRLSKAEKEREKAVQDRVQNILSGMLKDEDNKYCVDCDNKGPRWASWNLGIFLCIRCAGIHRNLGVHISKVKSVNLDSWTLQQVSSMQQMGNSKARTIYEASLPEDFRRPQTDSAVEAFVRQKYEKKKFLLPNWEPTKPPEIPIGWTENEETTAVTKAKTEVAKKVVLPARSPTAPVTARPPATLTKTATEPPRPVPAPAPPPTSTDLLGLLSPPSAPAPAPSSASSDLLGLQAEFGDFASAAPAVPPAQTTNSHDLFGTAPQATATTASTAESGKMSRDSIMALFGSQPPGQGYSAAPGSMFPAPGPQLGASMNLLGMTQHHHPPVGPGPQGPGSSAATNNPFLADTGLHLGGLNLGQGQASLWQ